MLLWPIDCQSSLSIDNPMAWQVQVFGNAMKHMPDKSRMPWPANEAGYLPVGNHFASWDCSYYTVSILSEFFLRNIHIARQR